MGWSQARAQRAVWAVQSEYVAQQEPAASVFNPQETGEAWALERLEKLKCVQMVVEFAPLMRLKTLFVLTLTHDLLLRGHPMPTGPCP